MPPQRSFVAKPQAFYCYSMSLTRETLSAKRPKLEKDIMKSLLALILVIVFSTTIQASEISTPTRNLDGTSISYDYTSGRSYNVKFQKKGVSYRYLTGSKSKKWWGPFAYKGFEVENNVYFVSWFEEGYGDYVTLLINFNNNILYGSAILSGKSIHFHGAKIVKVNRK